MESKNISTCSQTDIMMMVPHLLGLLGLLVLLIVDIQSATLPKSRYSIKHTKKLL